MHLHLPKALHGWREFMKEVGIIVVGVLIALGAEQLVPLPVGSTRPMRARRALHQEASDNLDAAAARIREQPCVFSRNQASCSRVRTAFNLA